MPYPNFHSCRLREPNGQETRYSKNDREHNGKSIDVIYQKKEGSDSWEEQAYRYSKTIWDAGDARRHCKSHHGISFEPASGESSAAVMNEKHFHADIKRKSEQDGHLIIEGWASTKAVDRADEVVEPEAFTNGIAAYLENPIIRYQHESGAIGKTLSATIDPVGGFWIKAMLSNAKDVEDVVTKIKEGILKAFSIGFKPMGKPEVVDGITHWKELELFEVSIVDIPCNRECLFSVAKGVQYGNDILVPEGELTRDVENLKIKMESIAAPAPPEPVNLQPGNEEEPENAYAKSLAELDKIASEIVSEHDEEVRDRHNEVMDSILKG